MRAPRYPVHPAAEILPMLPEPELRRLARDIKKRGLIHPVLLYQNQVLDGRNRIEACKRVGVEPHYKVVDPELDQRGLSPLEYVVSLNLRRRQLSPSQQAMAAAEVLPKWTAEGRRLREGNLRHKMRSADGVQLRHRGRSDQEVGKLFGVSPRYVRQAAQLKLQNEKLAGEVLAGNITLSRAVRIERAKAKQLADEHVLRQASRRGIQPVIRQFDARKPAIKGRFDLIVTDPPYAKDSLPLYDHLAALASRSLVEGGFLAVLTGHQYLDRAMVALARPKYGLQYMWTVCLAFDGQHGRLPGLNIATAWRPILLFAKPPARKPYHLLIDRISTAFPKFRRHIWEQAATAFEPLIRTLSRPGDRILDPFSGSGAVLEASIKLGRHAEGWDNDPKAIAIMEARFAIRAARG